MKSKKRIITTWQRSKIRTVVFPIKLKKLLSCNRRSNIMLPMLLLIMHWEICGMINVNTRKPFPAGNNRIAAKDGFAAAYRNLSLASYNKLKDTEKALSYLQKAFELDATDARVLMELDQLYKITGRSFVKDFHSWINIRH